MLMSSNSYLEFYLSLLAWIINNGIWNILADTGLFAAPFGAIILQEWLSARQQGADEGNKGLLSVPRIENRLWLAYIVVLFGCMPVLPLNLASMTLDDAASQRCGTSVTTPAETAWAATFNTIGEQSANVPVWWFLVHALSKGVTAAATAAIPCAPDIRQMRMEIDSSRIDSQVLLQEVADFTRDCYGYSRSRLFTNRPVLDKAQSHDASWIGSRYFLDTPGYYDTDRSRTPRVNWPYDESRDLSLPRLDNGAGYPTCRQWWSDSEIGLRDRLLQQLDPSLLTRLQGWLTGRSASDIEDAALRELVSPRLQSLTMAPGQIYQEYGSSARGSSIMHGLNNMATNTGLALGTLSNFPALNALRTALPMVQAFLIMAVIISLPLILLVSTYQLKTAMTLTFALFTLHMLTFWWELARWVDSSMLDTLYHQVATSDRLLLTLPTAGFSDGTVTAQVIVYVMGAMFIVLPMLFLAAMSWAGYRVGSVAEGMLAKGTITAQNAGSKGTDALASAGRSSMKRN
ncbi:conjugal transfer protein TraG N-terminal domain-containing protein [Pseudomonas sp. GD03721]|nr:MULTISPECIES: conjugal transfer protein TraG N-terminal domain-containing protein [unclassified Pseudomonas]MDH1440398.1 conjugal transfer protein TraG N-terminal domain-containing protein [Pseudomonas sp. GD03722]WGG03514.1 conjugal transfer protein TraG N-terminal domain-containing protein [Pseudomonas sp. GD03721]WGG07682.1 conjugal transfer protein TraG N-terminal domain-containing protein [Pseudomonas sp. GD03919]